MYHLLINTYCSILYVIYLSSYKLFSKVISHDDTGHMHFEVHITFCAKFHGTVTC